MLHVGEPRSRIARPVLWDYSHLRCFAQHWWVAPYCARRADCLLQLLWWIWFVAGYGTYGLMFILPKAIYPQILHIFTCRFLWQFFSRKTSQSLTNEHLSMLLTSCGAMMGVSAFMLCPLMLCRRCWLAHGLQRTGGGGLPSPWASWALESQCCCSTQIPNWRLCCCWRVLADFSMEYTRPFGTPIHRRCAHH